MANCTRIVGAATPSARTDWQSVLADSVRSPAELCRLLGLDPALAAEAEPAADGFSLLVPRPYVARIRRGDPADPLLLQVLPRAAETAASPGYSADPLGEVGACCGPGLLRKYPGRILMVTTGACAVHCRFCFRRHFPYENASAAADFWGPAVQKIAADGSLEEVILSGGDPLMLPDAVLGRLVDQFGRNPPPPPAADPQPAADRGSPTCDGRPDIADATGPLSPIVVVHVNHPAELDDDVAEALGRLVDAGIPVLNQSVLLRGVNDRADVLAELCRRLIDLRVMPYYLHQLDPVAGAAHFEVPIATGIALMAELRTRLPGYGVPRYVRETPGGASKEALL